MKNHKLISMRKSKGLTQEEVSKILKLANKSVVSNWENGHSKPTIDHAFKIASLLDTTVDYLFKEEN